MTDPLLLTAENQTEFGSVCTGAGEGPGSGTLNIGLRLSLQSETEPVPDGIVTMRALGIGTRLVECAASEAPAPGSKCRKKKRRHQ